VVKHVPNFRRVALEPLIFQVEARAGIEPALRQGLFEEIQGSLKPLIYKGLSDSCISLDMPKLQTMFLLSFLLY